MFFPAENKAAERRQAFHSDLGLIIANKMYVSSKTEDRKQRKYEQRDIKQAPLKVQKAQGEDATKNPRLCDAPSPQTLRLEVQPTGFTGVLDRKNSREEGGEEEGDAAFLYAKISVQDPP